MNNTIPLFRTARMTKEHFVLVMGII